MLKLPASKGVDDSLISQRGRLYKPAFQVYGYDMFRSGDISLVC